MSTREQRGYQMFPVLDYRWSEISRAFESKRYLVLMGSGVLQILPKRDFSSQTAGELRQLIRENLAQRARLAA